MRYLACFAACSALFLTSASADEIEGELITPPQWVAMIGFMSASHDFGEVVKGEMVEFKYDFLNNGTSPLTISRAHSTVANVAVGHSGEAVEAGSFGQIFVRIDTKDMEPGVQTIRIKVESDAYNAPSTLYADLEVMPAPDAAEIDTSAEDVPAANTNIAEAGPELEAEAGIAPKA